ncbi:hypothetical protein FOL47_009281 [Perkinsus chesapeaki]|uniref:Uncharacterized protein n=1 Tax=Perkinsus chesapeaki TaxID=330153 RepID=A0A7J6L9D3_PERCH|nr:hypothetical protein FOL47_009281 [Perkinsus chesapeaki]
MSLRTPNYEKDHVYVYVFINDAGDGEVSSGSHFCAKLHVWLELAGLPYTLCRATGPGGPYGKVPFIELNGETYGDSSAIIKMLSDKYDKDLDADLSPEQKASSKAVQRMVEEHTYFLTLADIAFQKEAFDVLTDKLMHLNALTKWFVPSFVLRNFKANLNGQGIGRLPEKERNDRMREDVEALSVILGEKKYVANDVKPTTVDATVFGYLWACFDTDTSLTKFMSSYTECKKYVRFTK